MNFTKYAASLALFAIATAAAPPAAIPVGKLTIARQVSNKLDCEIYSYNPDSKEKEAITNANNVGALKLIFSPDSSKVAFYDDNYIYTMNVFSKETTSKRTFSDTNSYRITGLTFNPSGDKLILVGKKSKSEGDVHQIYELDANKLDQTFANLTNISNFDDKNSFMLNPTYSSDGKYIIYIRKSTTNAINSIVVFDTQTRQNVSEFKVSSKIDTFAISTSGNKVSIAFPESEINGNDKSKISLVQSSDDFKTFSDKECIHRTKLSINSLSFSPDSNFIVYTDDVLGKMIIMDINTKAIKTHELFNMKSLRWIA